MPQALAPLICVPAQVLLQRIALQHWCHCGAATHRHNTCAGAHFHAGHGSVQIVRRHHNASQYIALAATGDPRLSRDSHPRTLLNALRASATRLGINYVTKCPESRSRRHFVPTSSSRKRWFGEGLGTHMVGGAFAATTPAQARVPRPNVPNTQAWSDMIAKGTNLFVRFAPPSSTTPFKT